MCLKLSPHSLPTNHAENTLICKTKIWELWQNPSGNYVFIAPQGAHPRGAVINPRFQNGVVYSDQSLSSQHNDYPLQALDNIIFVNWLGTFADIILHASGAVIEDNGYAFIGPAGAGKSTLVNALQQAVPSEVLGEDQVVLRFLEQRFWIYGTPWHENPALCSAVGAPLAKLFYLDRDPTKPASCTRLKPPAAVQRILQTAFIPYYRQDLLPGILDRLARLVEQVPCYVLNFRLGTDPWNLVQSC